MSIAVRFVDIIKDSDIELNVPQIIIREHFWGFVPLTATTGAFITETFIEQLEQMGLAITNLRGQSYDNQSNMKGKEKGVQNRVLQINPCAFFVPCNSHSLNLVVNDAAMYCLEAISLFGLVQQVYNYFSASTHQWQVISSHIEFGITVKPLSETRWESRIDALRPLRLQLGNVYDALIEIYEDTSLTGASGNTSRNDAKALADAILSLWYPLLLGTTSFLK